jgi:hypothetical protein
MLCEKLMKVVCVKNVSIHFQLRNNLAILKLVYFSNSKLNQIISNMASITINLYGISFIDDSHIELLTSNCIHLETLALNFCLRVKGSSFKTLIQRCKKLKTLLLQHTGK